MGFRNRHRDDGKGDEERNGNDDRNGNDKKG